MMNKAIFLGRLTKDPKLTKTKNGASKTRFNLAVQKDYVQEGNTADYIPIVCWNKLADNVEKYCFKGRMVTVEAHIQTRSYDDSEGQTKFILEIVADKITFLGAGKKENESTDETVSEIEESQNDFGISEDGIQF